MNKEIYAILGVGVALAAILVTSIGGLRADMRDGHAATRAEMREANAAVRADIADVRSEMRSGQAALRGEIAEVRLEMRSEIGSVRTELAEIRAALARLSERVTRIEVLLGLPVDETSTAGQ